MWASCSAENFISSVEVLKHEEDDSGDTKEYETAFDQNLVRCYKPDVSIDGVG